MRFLLVILTLTALISCGKNSESSSSAPQAQQCEVDGHSVSCDSIYDGLGVDILDSQIDAPATVTASDISFNESRTTRTEGRRIECTTTVTKGDVYHYSVNGDVLSLDTPAGNIQMKKVHGEGGVVGTWKWSGIVDGATYETKLMTVLKGMNRVIMKTICER